MVRPANSWHGTCVGWWCIGSGSTRPRSYSRRGWVEPSWLSREAMESTARWTVKYPDMAANSRLSMSRDSFISIFRKLYSSIVMKHNDSKWQCKLSKIFGQIFQKKNFIHQSSAYLRALFFATQLEDKLRHIKNIIQVVTSSFLMTTFQQNNLISIIGVVYHFDSRKLVQCKL